MTEPTQVQRPPTRLYEVRTIHGEAYRAEGDVIESGDGWFTLWADESTLALRIPEADIRAVRQVYPEEDLAADAHGAATSEDRVREVVREELDRMARGLNQALVR